MKTDVLTAIKEERDHIEAEIDKLNEELEALNIVLNRNTVKETTVRRTKAPTNDSEGNKYTKSEQRVIDALNAIGGKGTVREIFNHLLIKFPRENETKLHSSARQFTSSMGRSGKLSVEKREGNIGSIYSLK